MLQACPDVAGCMWLLGCLLVLLLKFSLIKYVCCGMLADANNPHVSWQVDTAVPSYLHCHGQCHCFICV